MKSIFGKPEAPPAIPLTVTEPYPSVVDGKEVLNLAKWIRDIRDACEAGRDRFYPAEGFKGYIQDCHRWYTGDHWDSESSINPDLQAPDDELYVENRVAEKVDVIYPILVEGRPVIKILPRTGGDVDRAAALDEVVDFKLRQAGFGAFLIRAMKKSPIYGSGITRLEHLFHRGEPDGINKFSVCDPLSVAWDAYADTFEDSKVIIHVELWDKSDAEAHFSTLIGEPITDLPAGGEGWTKWQDWSLTERLRGTANLGTSASPPNKFLEKTLITWVWYRDSERLEDPVMEDYVELEPQADEYGFETQVPTQKQRQQSDDQGNLIFNSHPKYPNARLMVMAGEDRIIYDGTNPYMHGEIPFVPVHFSPEDSIFGKPLVKNIHHLQFLINSALTQIAKHANLSGFPSIEVDRNLLENSQREFTNEPGQIIYTNSPDGRRVVRPVEYGNLNASVLQNYSLASDAIERIAGVSNVSTGQANASDSGIKVQSLDDITTRKLEPFEQSRDQMIERLGKMFLYNIFQFTSMNEMVRIAVDNPQLSLGEPDAQGQIQPQIVPGAPETQHVPLGSLFGNMEDLEYDVIVVPAPGNATPRQRNFAMTKEPALQGMALPNQPMQYTDVPNLNNQMTAMTAAAGARSPSPKNNNGAMP